MTEHDTTKLKHGLYRLYWKSGGCSLASVGSLYDGTRWFAPANWTGDGRMEVSTNWAMIERVERIDAVVDPTEAE